ncbi:BTB/POZ domain-containing protein [Camellia lanceoleosa]|uniref:BTB/POZ domain-containing protein n=1 Tax=Camellia lanceoleosa TaxID=1840588 RepID=A0ACC0HFB0_9ERIC|nr:BTB/POZ domain-containing protein [Camellia lanceoleosa]
MSFSTDPSLLGWPVNEKSSRSGGRKTIGRVIGADSWLDELAHLGLILFKRLIFSMKARNLSPEIIENSHLLREEIHSKHFMRWSDLELQGKREKNNGFVADIHKHRVRVLRSEQLLL